MWWSPARYRAREAASDAGVAGDGRRTRSAVTFSNNLAPEKRRKGCELGFHRTDASPIGRVGKF
jgi:hypothetical protein